MVLTPNLAHSILPLFFTVMLANVWILPGSLPRVLGVGLFGALTLFHRLRFLRRAGDCRFGPAALAAIEKRE